MDYDYYISTEKLAKLKKSTLKTQAYVCYFSCQRLFAIEILDIRKRERLCVVFFRNMCYNNYNIILTNNYIGF